MANTSQRIFRPRVQTPEQERAELELRERMQLEKPSFQDLMNRGDVETVTTMGEYWGLLQTFAALKALRESEGLSISEMADRTGMDHAMISLLENGQIGNPTISSISRYAQALGKRVVVSLADA